MSAADDATTSTPRAAPLVFWAQLLQVSAVIPAYNAQAHISACLNSVLAQTGNFSLEIIVVDDGSTDSTAEIVGQYAGVQFLRQANAGPSAARNRGIEAATGDVVAFLDADDLWPAGKLQAQLDILQAHPEVALVFGDCRQFNGNGMRQQTEFEAAGFGRAAWGPGPLLSRAYARLLENNAVTTGSVLVRRTALAEAGGFAEDLRLVEDLDLWLRIARHHPLAWSAAECLHRRRHDSNISGDAEAVGLAYLVVLARHADSWAPGEAALLGVNARRLAASEHLHLSELAARKGRMTTAWQRLWFALATYPSPHNAWRSAKSAVKLGAHMLGLRA